MPAHIPIITIQVAEQLRAALDDFLEHSEASFALVIDRGGAILSECGTIPPSSDPTIMSALAAGSFAATKELALRVGETEFNMLHQQGTQAHVLMRAVDDDAVLLIVFGEKTTVGLVRFYSTQAVKTIAAVLHDIRTAQYTPPIFSQQDIAQAGRVFGG